MTLRTPTVIRPNWKELTPSATKRLRWLKARGKV